LQVSIEVSWYNQEQTILLARAVQKWTWEDYYASRETMAEMIAAVNHSVDIIVDGGKFALPPNALTNFRRSSWKHEPRVGSVVLIAPHGFLRAMYQMYTTLVRKSERRFWMVSSLQEALQHLEQPLKK
jgi:hypothetical protein